MALSSQAGGGRTVLCHDKGKVPVPVNLGLHRAAATAVLDEARTSGIPTMLYCSPAGTS